jgi:hypothetical protein
MSFARDEKANQRAWAERDPCMKERLDDRHGAKTWVLKKDAAKHNGFDTEWWAHIAPRVHRWGRALNSSQAFALNLFAPALERGLARAVWPTLSSRHLPSDATVIVRFEFDYATDAGGRYFGVKLGERRQRTQIDVLFEVESASEPGALLIEVKYTEDEFGTCRGGRTGDPGCSEVAQLARDPEKCWLAQNEGRKYWSLMTQPGSSFRFPQTTATPCPFRDDLYQLMRNRVLADAMRHAAGLHWADTAICIHPGNTHLKTRLLGDAGNRGFRDDFVALSHAELRLLEPSTIADALAASSSTLAPWRNYILERYRI